MRLSTCILVLSFNLLYALSIAQNKPKPNSIQVLDNETLYRPAFHFTPTKGWMNDPNGMIFLNGQYHLFYQHYPDSTVWGPMHWGQATSKDLVEWAHQPIALFPDSIGMIFSGSAVLDKNNTSGLGRNGVAPLVAIFTQHNMPGEKAGRVDFQNQSIAYSLDEGKTWIKYAGNPVLKTPNLKDFRDPKVIWHAASKKWIMSLAVGDHVEFYSAPNLIDWTKETEFGKGQFAHGGVWECPDLLSFNLDGRTIWVLLVSMNPGGPNGGSATQYMVGDFDGHEFKPFTTQTKWMDYGPDNYAGVSFSNLGDRNVLIGWMSNWNYANLVPTEKWRSAMTVPRELSLVKHNTNGNATVNTNPSTRSSENDFLLVSNPVQELDARFAKIASKDNLMPNRIELRGLEVADFTIVFSNDYNEKLVVGFDAGKQEYFVDRTHSGIASFQNTFASKSTATRLRKGSTIDLTLLMDKTSIELFADGGRTLMTALFFPTHPYTKWTIQSTKTIPSSSMNLFSFK
jgi:fructan beta-fructosidase